MEKDNNLIVNVECSSCRAISRIEILERTYGSDWRYKHTPVSYCPVCASQLDENEVTTIQDGR